MSVCMKISTRSGTILHHSPGLSGIVSDHTTFTPHGQADEEKERTPTAAGQGSSQDGVIPHDGSVCMVKK